MARVAVQRSARPSLRSCSVSRATACSSCSRPGSLAARHDRRRQCQTASSKSSRQAVLRRQEQVHERVLRTGTGRARGEAQSDRPFRSARPSRRGTPSAGASLGCESRLSAHDPVMGQLRRTRRALRLRHRLPGDIGFARVLRAPQLSPPAASRPPRRPPRAARDRGLCASSSITPAGPGRGHGQAYAGEVEQVAPVVGVFGPGGAGIQHVGAHEGLVRRPRSAGDLGKRSVAVAGSASHVERARGGRPCRRSAAGASAISRR